MALCPLLSKCNAKTSIDQYIKTCSNITADEYKNCPIYQKMTSEQRTPVEWSRLLSL